jgi:hypothetical protein
MKNIAALTLLATGLVISIMSSPALAIPEKQRIEESKTQQDEKMNREIPNPKYNSPDTSGFNGLGSLGPFNNMAVGTVSTNGIVQYGVEFTGRFDNAHLRVGAYLGGGGSALDGDKKGAKADYDRATKIQFP